MKDQELTALKETITPRDERFFKGLLYGEFGMRKTTTGLRLSRRRAILVHADRGWNAIYNHPEEFEDVVPVAYQGLSQIKLIVEAVTTNTEPFNDVDLIMVDTISQIQENYIDFLLENVQYAGKYREKATPKTGKKLEDGAREIEIPGMPDYHLARNKIRPIITLLSRAPVDVIFTAHLREPSPIEKTAGKVERRPNITEALYKVVAREATFIGLMEKRKEDYTINFKPDNRTSAKSQIASLTDKQINVNELPQMIWDWKQESK